VAVFFFCRGSEGEIKYSNFVHSVQRNLENGWEFEIRFLQIFAIFTPGDTASPLKAAEGMSRPFLHFLENAKEK
jgi:hypothetical protein